MKRHLWLTLLALLAVHAGHSLAAQQSQTQKEPTFRTPIELPPLELPPIKVVVHKKAPPTPVAKNPSASKAKVDRIPAPPPPEPKSPPRTTTVVASSPKAKPAAGRTPPPVPRTTSQQQLTPAWASSPATRPCVKCPPTLCDRECRGWTAQLGALIMFRSNPDAFRYIEDPTALNSGVDAGDFRFGPAAGIEASITAHQVTPGQDLEFRYMSVDGWSDSLFAAVAGNPFSINTNPATFVSGPRDVFASYKSSFQSFELNARRTVQQNGSCSRTQLLVGFRHLSIDETLQNRLVSTATPAISTEHFNVSTDNNLYGLQLGFDSMLAGDCNFCLEGFGKAGVYANDSSQRSTLANEVTTPPTVFTASGSDSDIAFALETGLNLTYRLNQQTSCFLGYRAIWVDGLSLASNQVAHTGFAPGLANPAVDDDIIYHGLRCGFEFAF